MSGGQRQPAGTDGRAVKGRRGCAPARRAMAHPRHRASAERARVQAGKIVSRPVSRVLYGGVAPAWRPFIWDARCRTPRATNPDDWPGNRLGLPPRRPYSVLLPVGFAMPSPLPGPRWALTPPFHPCRGRTRGGSISVALSLRSPSPDVIRHRCSMEPGLSSPARAGAAARPTDRPGLAAYGAAGQWNSVGQDPGHTETDVRKRALSSWRKPGSIARSTQ